MHFRFTLRRRAGSSITRGCAQLVTGVPTSCACAAFIRGVWIALGFVGAITFGAEHRVTTAQEIANACAAARPGDVIIMREGAWNDAAINFHAQGLATQLITLRAETPGGVVLSGKSSIAMEGEHLVLSGVLLRHGEGDADGITVRGRHCRVTDCAVTESTYKSFVHLWGTNHELDRCFFAGKTSVSPTLQIDARGGPNRHRIHHNYFGMRPPLRRNGGETIRIGYSHQSMNECETVVEENLFAQCNGENEIISNKACGNVYRSNTFFECAGLLTLRHGNRCVVEGNFFFGHNVRGSGGIRVIGEDHLVMNNYIDSVEQPAIWITSGIVDSPLNGYFQAKRCLIAFNTIVNCRSAALDLSAGIGTSQRTLRPREITIANNLIVRRPGVATLFKGDEGDDYVWRGNIVSGSSEKPEVHHSVRFAECAMMTGADRVTRPDQTSGVRGAAEGNLGPVRDDIDGQVRAAPADVGCDQFSDAPILKRPLTPRDVGPSWMMSNDTAATSDQSAK
jgi:poly(beta-D-mannuronate) lyase